MSEPGALTADAADSVPPSGRPRRRRWPAIVGWSLLGMLALVVGAMTIVRVPYVIISPGEATRLDRRVVSISGTRSYRHRGDLLYLTVRLNDKDPNIWRWLVVQLDDDVTVEKREDVIGCASYADDGRLQDALMRDSQRTAKKVALERLGYALPEVGRSAVIENVECGGPSEGRLRPGDRVTAVEGTPVDTAEAIGPLVKARAPGERIRVAVDRGGEARDVTVRLGARDGKGFLGILTRTLHDWKFPVDVEIDTARVSGPSAGLAFALAIIDDLTPGSLTGGHDVAVTGSIAEDGSVGPVGGVAQKAVAARDAGAKLMLVPVGEAAEARRHAGSMKIVAVRTLDDALRALARAGGAPVVETPTTQPSGT